MKVVLYCMQDAFLLENKVSASFTICVLCFSLFLPLAIDLGFSMKKHAEVCKKSNASEYRKAY
jgi:hypothetical protein